jgi:S1-C subfamily serine protease
MGRKVGVTLLGIALFASGCSLEGVLEDEEPAIPAPAFTQNDSPLPTSDLADVVERVLPSVVNVRVSSLIEDEFGDTTEASGQGSGVVIRSDGVIITNAHVVQDATEVRIVFSDDREALEGEVLGALPEQDLAVVKVDADDLTPIDIGSSSRLRLGDTVTALGFPLGLGGPTVTSGIVSGIGRTIQPQSSEGTTITLENMLQTDAAINPGNSGGALVDAAGRLVGINSAAAGAGSAENVGFAIPIDSALPVVEDIIDGGLAWLGVFLQAVDSAVASQLELDPDTRGVLIVEIIEGGPADDADLETGSVITELDGVAIETFEDLTREIAERDPGDVVELTLVSEDGTDVVEVELGERPVEVPERD